MFSHKIQTYSHTQIARHFKSILFNVYTWLFVLVKHCYR